MRCPTTAVIGVRRTAACVLLVATTVIGGCGVADYPTHEVTYELSGPATEVHTVRIDPPGEQADNVETEQRPSLPWSQTRDSGYGFARLTASGNGPLTCRIREGETVLATASGGAGATVECRANIQDG